jgi:hypothetical protein
MRERSRKPGRSFGDPSLYGTVGITIEVLEYVPATGEMVIVKPRQHWDPESDPERPALPASGSHRVLGWSGGSS